MHRFVLTLSQRMAWAGGAMLCLLISVTALSVLGRGMNGALQSETVQQAMPQLAAWLLSLGIGPVLGDYELVEAGIAFSIFAFLPLCQITGSHADVDLFTARWSPRANRWRQMITDIAFAVVLVLIAAQLAAGTASKMKTGQTTFLIQFPLWWAYALGLSGAAVAALVSLYVAALRVGEVMQGRSPDGPLS